MTATQVYSLAFPSNEVIGTVVFQIIGAAWAGSAIPQMRLGGPQAASDSGLVAGAFKNCAYINVATGAQVAAGTAITADGIYAVTAPGVEVALSHTQVTGSALVYFTPLELPLSQYSAGIIGDLTNGIYVQSKPSSATVTVVSIATTATLIVAANTARKALIIQNADAAAAMFIGTSSGVTTANGYKVAAGASVTLSPSNNTWYGIVASGTVSANAIEV